MLLSLSLLAQWPIRNHITKAIHSQLKVYVTTFPVNTLYAEIIDCLALTHILKSQYMDKYLPINLKKRKVQHSSQHLCLYYPLSVFIYYSHAPSLTLPAPTTTQYYSTNTATSCANIWVCRQIPNHTDQSPRYYPTTEGLWTTALIFCHFPRRFPSPRIYQIKAFLKYFVNILFIQARRDKEGLSHKAVEIGFLSQNNN